MRWQVVRIVFTKECVKNFAQKDCYLIKSSEYPAELFCLEFKNKADVVEVNHGEWKLHPDGSGTCSCCNFTQKNVWDYDNAQNFCGHCGADMRGEE